MADRSANEAKKDYIEKMGNDLGAQFASLWQEVVHLHLKWSEYVALFGTKPSRIELLNRAAPGFFRMIQDVLWEEALLHIARLTDAPGREGRENLTLLNLPDLVDDRDFSVAVRALVEKVLNKTKFCRDWRNRHIAHRDLDLTMNERAVPLKSASRKQVSEALSVIADSMNLVEVNYANSTTYFGIGFGAGGSASLLHVLDSGVRSEEKQLERLHRGEMSEDDPPREL